MIIAFEGAKLLAHAVLSEQNGMELPDP